MNCFGSLQVPSLGSQDDNSSNAPPRGNGWLELGEWVVGTRGMGGWNQGALGLAARPRSNTENAERQRLAYSLRAVLDIQLAQNLLHVIFYRQRADLQDGSDLDVALTEMNPFQDFLLARGQNAGTRRLYGSAPYRPVDLSAHPRLVQERHDQLDAIDLFWIHGLRLAGKNEKARRFPESIEGSMPNHGVRPDSDEFAPQLALGERTRVPCLADHGPVGVLFPGFYEVRHHRCVPAQHVAEERGLERRR